MKNRLNYFKGANNPLQALSGFAPYLAKSPLDKSLLELIYFRVSQINSCAFCLDMHTKELRAMGEEEHRLYVMDAWREAPFYSDRERAALAFAEALTKVSTGNVSDEVYNAAAAQFSEGELVDLAIAIVAINGYNRLNIAFGSPMPVGTYKVGQFAEKN
ncbi:MAG: carboxymuconolactone decarboxylase family protein [Bacteroidetes bacterium]|uniref:carboxymuconolactone decarboxylase family protein n=1 Tax=unclassified Chitinophaga TaxID=2619133 RepID=UPI0009D120AE|nr:MULTISPECIES: carboxymuconolactone decarboxylase family protein [unclassified Chitinophaga]MBP1651021.1 carboxymuconolactone decarboxylase family protein [Bacteroidota bacterium]OMP76519.1 carboxymuconolactone decarboxylase [[Flexibacter] sp. ATCC 35208]WPV63969.1 carboxymuconolactone decarboxylase family protein [Chitinophaga sp. LS1]